jgi:ATP-binding protein involved in chromosome partitioning
VRHAAVVLTAHKQAAPVADPRALPGVRHVVAVASGKGGVGKSTVAVNLAAAMAQSGLRVGLLDADIYGPSLPRMLGALGKPGLRDKIMIPVQAYGMACMSIGFMVPEDQAMVWRGPMVMGALQQLLSQTDWGELDVLVVDMPPGTGDVQLTLSQKVDLAGAVIVSTPQDIALLDARRGVAMFAKVGVKILGVVENMSFFQCPHCGERTDLFGHGGAEAEATKLNVPFLGAVPLLLDVRTAGDAGHPVVLGVPNSPAAVAFRDIAARVAKMLA